MYITKHYTIEYAKKEILGFWEGKRNTTQIVIPPEDLLISDAREVFAKGIEQLDLPIILIYTKTSLRLAKE